MGLFDRFRKGSDNDDRDYRDESESSEEYANAEYCPHLCEFGHRFPECMAMCPYEDD